MQTHLLKLAIFFLASNFAIFPSSQSLLNSKGNLLEDLCNKDPMQSAYAHPHLCTKYIECDPSGTVFIKTCKPGTFYNPNLHTCSQWTQNVSNCQDRPEDKPMHRELNHRSKRSPKGETGYFENVIPDPNYCNKYILLSSAGGHYSTHSCGEGTLFNPLSSVCDFADNVDCSSRQNDFGRYACSKTDKYRAPHPDHCNKFVECERGVLAVKACPPATLYQRDEEKCDHSYKVQCRKQVSLEYDMSRSKRDDLRRRRAPQNKLNLACEYNYIAPHPHNCHQFVECEDKRIYIKNCGPGTAFNPLLGQCDWPDNVRAPHPYDCTQYRQCVQTKYETRYCRQDQIFDERVNECKTVSRYYREQECNRKNPTTTPPPDYDQPIFVTPRPS